MEGIVCFRWYTGLKSGVPNLIFHSSSVVIIGFEASDWAE